MPKTQLRLIQGGWEFKPYPRSRWQRIVDALWWLPLFAIMVPFFMGDGGYVVLAALLLWLGLEGPAVIRRFLLH